MIQLILLASLFHSGHQKQFIAETLMELAHASAQVGDYQHNPPLLTTSNADAMYISRAEDDISLAVGAVVRYKHHRGTEKAVKSLMSQLERDLEDIPPAHFPDDVRSTT